MVAISYFFYKRMLVDFSVMFYVYTKKVMPTKSARVSTECTIANIMQFMEHYYNNDTVTVIYEGKISDVETWKWFGLFIRDR
jgi:hypothetical protein